MNSLPKSDRVTIPSSECGYLTRLPLRLKPEVVFLFFACVFGFSLLMAIPSVSSPG